MWIKQFKLQTYHITLFLQINQKYDVGEACNVSLNKQNTVYWLFLQIGNSTSQKNPASKGIFEPSVKKQDQWGILLKVSNKDNAVNWH